MIHLSTILVWVFGLLVAVAASPVAQSPAFGDIQLPEYDGSIQLVLREMLDNNFWFLFQGPFGVAVKLCEHDHRFHSPGMWVHPGPADVNHPPFPTQIEIKVKIGNREDCWYLNDGKGNAGRLQCGYPYDLWYDFKRDPQWDKPTEQCAHNGMRAHRAFYVEY
ncbi:hypothetical protein G6011_03726 [Alternaria panax]|uniref:Uncharacterized protein n=1 Tax=Alternaria panax TaxID=48097 RepID=A0AAD4IF95_9PLEO|nr:hypothetical protein G6011_03726 [Alternaria panax]